MPSLMRPILRLVVGPALVAAFAGFELRGAGPLAEAAGGYAAFAASIFLITAWGRWHLRLVERHLRRAGRKPDQTWTP